MIKKVNKKRNQKGFTLVELIVVIAILGILAAIAVPKFSSSKESAQIAAHNVNVRTLMSVGQMYILENPSLTSEVKLVAGGKGTDVDGDLNDYLEKSLEIPSGLKGKTYLGLESVENEEVKVEIKKTDNYEVNIKVDGTIVVTPREIKGIGKIGESDAQ